MARIKVYNGTTWDYVGNDIANLVTTSGSQTLTNKTLTTPTIGDLSNATHDHTNDAGGGSLLFAKTYEILFNNGTGARSTTTSTSMVDIPGATGDTSYTAPAGHDVTLVLWHTQMTDQTSGQLRFATSVGGATLTPYSYIDFGNTGGGWNNFTLVNQVDVDAGDTVAITGRWTTSSGTATITNATGDTSFPNQIIYQAFKRVT